MKVYIAEEAVAGQGHTGVLTRLYAGAAKVKPNVETVTEGTMTGHLREGDEHTFTQGSDVTLPLEIAVPASFQTSALGICMKAGYMAPFVVFNLNGVAIDRAGDVLTAAGGELNTVKRGDAFRIYDADIGGAYVALENAGATTANAVKVASFNTVKTGDFSAVAADVYAVSLKLGTELATLYIEQHHEAENAGGLITKAGGWSPSMKLTYKGGQIPTLELSGSATTWFDPDVNSMGSGFDEQPKLESQIARKNLSSFHCFGPNAAQKYRIMELDVTIANGSEIGESDGDDERRIEPGAQSVTGSFRLEYQAGHEAVFSDQALIQAFAVDRAMSDDMFVHSFGRFKLQDFDPEGDGTAFLSSNFKVSPSEELMAGTFFLPATYPGP